MCETKDVRVKQRLCSHTKLRGFPHYTRCKKNAFASEHSRRGGRPLNNAIDLTLNNVMQLTLNNVMQLTLNNVMQLTLVNVMVNFRDVAVDLYLVYWNLFQMECFRWNVSLNNVMEPVSDVALKVWIWMLLQMNPYPHKVVASWILAVAYCSLQAYSGEVKAPQQYFTLCQYYASAVVLPSRLRTMSVLFLSSITHCVSNSHCVCLPQQYCSVGLARTVYIYTP